MNRLTLSPTQAGALARLIHNQLDAYAEADCGPEASQAARKRRDAAEPFTGSDLVLIEPLVVLLEKLACE